MKVWILVLSLYGDPIGAVGAFPSYEACSAKLGNADREEVFSAKGVTLSCTAKELLERPSRDFRGGSV